MCCSVVRKKSSRHGICPTLLRDAILPRQSNLRKRITRSLLSSLSSLFSSLLSSLLFSLLLHLGSTFTGGHIHCSAKSPRLYSFIISMKVQLLQDKNVKLKRMLGVEPQQMHPATMSLCLYLLLTILHRYHLRLTL